MLKTLLAGLLLAIAWLVFVAYAAFEGVWMRPIAPSGDSQAFFQHAVRNLETSNPGATSLLMLEDGVIVAEFHHDPKGAVDGDTMFAAASVSKWMTAYAMMTLIADGKADLDTPVNDYLSRWQLPADARNEGVTIRRLLSHTAGLNDGLGFGEYAADETLPLLEDELTKPRTSSGRPARITVMEEPGTEWQYSGGGYLLLELLIEEISGQTFEDYTEAAVYHPLGMARTGYDLIDSYENNAGVREADGNRIAGYKYASSAATALVTSSSDLAKFIHAHIGTGISNPPLSQKYTRSMRAPHGRRAGFDIWGLGTILYAPTEGGDFIFGHDGANEPGINAAIRINPENSSAVVIMVSGHPTLATNIGSDWVFWQSGYPDLFATDAVLSSMLIPGLVGALGIAGLTLLLGVAWRGKR